MDSEIYEYEISRDFDSTTIHLFDEKGRRLTALFFSTYRQAMDFIENAPSMKNVKEAEYNDYSHLWE